MSVFIGNSIVTHYQSVVEIEICEKNEAKGEQEKEKEEKRKIDEFFSAFSAHLMGSLGNDTWGQSRIQNPESPLLEISTPPPELG